MTMTEDRPRRVALLLAAVLSLSLAAPAVGARSATAATVGSLSGTVTVPDGHSTVGVRAILWHHVVDHDGEGWVEGVRADVAANGTYVLPAAVGEYVVQFTDPSGELGSVYNGGAHHRARTTTHRVTWAGQAVGGVDATMVEASSIRGRVIAPARLPSEPGAVGVWRQVDGTDEWVRMDTPSVALDGEGRYAWIDLPPGAYRVQALGSSTSVATWFPDVEAEDEAEEVVIAAGEDRTGVDVTQSTGATLKGRISVPEKVDPTEIVVNVLQQDRTLEAWAQVDADGTYEVPAVAAGRYRLLFQDLRGRLPDEYYDDAATFAKAAEVDVRRDSTVTGLRARLTEAGPGKGDPSSLRRLKRLEAPRVSGSVRLGGTLVATRGTWKPKRVKVRFQWFLKDGRHAVAVKGASRPRLTLTRQLRGERLRVRVTVSKRGFRTRACTTRWSKKVR